MYVVTVRCSAELGYVMVTRLSVCLSVCVLCDVVMP